MVPNGSGPDVDTGDSKATGSANGNGTPKRRRPLLRRALNKLLGRVDESIETVTPPRDPIVLTDDIRVDHGNRPFKLIFGKSAIQVVPDHPVDAAPGDPVEDWLVATADSGFEDSDEGPTFAPFVRLEMGAELVVGLENEAANDVWQLRKSVGPRRVSLSNNSRRGMVVELLDPDRETSLVQLGEGDAGHRRVGCRRDNLRAIADIIGGPVRQLDPDAAAVLLQDVLDLTEDEAYREKNAEGKPGGLLEIPRDKDVILIGDMHGLVDNLLRVLTEDGILSMMAQDRVCVVILGDAFHLELKGRYDDMESSVEMLDLLLALKAQFPRNIFYLRGNHDSFTEDISKGGIPQGVVFKKRLKELRGGAYAKMVQAYFRGLPYVATNRDFLCCHAAPPRSAVPRQMIVDAAKYPGLTHELVTGRMKTQTRLAGYRKKDVRAFRSSFDLDRHTPFIVGHTPLTDDDTIWTHVGDIRYHHVLYSANPEQVGVFVRVGRKMVPQVYRVEPLQQSLAAMLEEDTRAEEARVREAEAAAAAQAEQAATEEDTGDSALEALDPRFGHMVVDDGSDAVAETEPPAKSRRKKK